MISKIFALIAGFGLSACASGTYNLTEAGQNVDVVTKEEAPKGAKYIGDVESRTATGSLKACATGMTDVKNDLRSQAAEQGGNLVVIDTVVIRGACHHGSGRVFRK